MAWRSRAILRATVALVATAVVLINAVDGRVVFGFLGAVDRTDIWDWLVLAAQMKHTWASSRGGLLRAPPAVGIGGDLSSRATRRHGRAGGLANQPANQSINQSVSRQSSGDSSSSQLLL
jgi:hypothetical protein